MFGIGKRDLVANLVKIQQALCCYIGGKGCDCKYGAQNAGQSTESGPGCPEVAQAAALIGAMTPEEFERICNRAQVRV